MGRESITDALTSELVIPGTSFTLRENAELIRLLKKVQSDNYRWPTEESMREAHRTVSFWATELVVLRRRGDITEVLLARYKGGVKEFLGFWHFPGGYNRWPEKDIQATCSATAKREIGVDVLYTGIIAEHKWKNGEHPYGHPLSLFSACILRGNLEETDSLRFFPVNMLPEPIVAVHREFIEKKLC